jgi:hypothetical protein
LLKNDEVSLQLLPLLYPRHRSPCQHQLPCLPRPRLRLRLRLSFHRLHRRRLQWSSMQAQASDLIATILPHAGPRYLVGTTQRLSLDLSLLLSGLDRNLAVAGKFVRRSECLRESWPTDPRVK